MYCIDLFPCLPPKLAIGNNRIYKRLICAVWVHSVQMEKKSQEKTIGFHFAGFIVTAGIQFGGSFHF